MLYVFNKSKICSYLVSIFTVSVLFVSVASLDNSNNEEKELIETSSNIINNNLNNDV